MKKSYLISIGVMVFITLGLIMKGLLFLHPKPGNGGTKVRVLFQNIDKISQGSRVSFAGKPVGEVESIFVIPQALENRPKNSEIIYPYELLLSIDSSIRIYETDSITAKTAGLLGERFIEITPQSTHGKSLTLVTPLKKLYAYEPPTVEDTFQDISHVTKKADTVFNALLVMIEKSQEPLLKTCEALESTVQNAQKFVEKANRSQIFSECAKTLSEIKYFFSTINNGNGTLSQLVHNPILYKRLNTSLHKIDDLVDSISSFGLLFHTNSSWQRANILKKKQKQHDVETVLDQINMLIKPYKNNPQRVLSRELIIDLENKIAEFQKIEEEVR